MLHKCLSTVKRKKIARGAGHLAHAVVGYSPKIQERMETAMSDSLHTFSSFCGTEVSREQQSMIMQIIERYARLTRTELASTLCELLEWTRPNGKLKTVECRQFLEQLEQKGFLKLPTKQHRCPRQVTAIALTEARECHQDVQGRLKDFRPITLTLVKRADDRVLWKAGITRGRGRQDSQHKRHGANPKRIFLLPLQRQAREQLRCTV